MLKRGNRQIHKGRCHWVSSNEVQPGRQGKGVNKYTTKNKSEGECHWVPFSELQSGRQELLFFPHIPLATWLDKFG